jgi:hypothetical protein
MQGAGRTFYFFIFSYEQHLVSALGVNEHVDQPERAMDLF